MKGREIDYYFKIIIMSRYDSGKTNFILRYCDNNHIRNTLRTIGLDFKSKYIELDNKKIRIQIWDTANGERSYYMIKNCIKVANGIIILYDITKRETFESAKSYVFEIKEEYPEKIIAFVGNKIDLLGESEVTIEEGQNFADENNLIFYETSTLEGINVNECFEELIYTIYQNNSEKEKNEKNIILNGSIRRKRPPKRGCLK
jgi:Ras-related protein Rab-18